MDGLQREVARKTGPARPDVNVTGKVTCTHPDGLLAQPGAPRHLGARLRRRVVGSVEQRLELLGLTVGEHRPHPGLLPQLRLRVHPARGRMVTMVTGQLRRI